ncbi:MAG TPA: T9SS type A sorting domain-containing protein [Bacteroidia bacterium]|nr:T9SS type A sorting domain-containing protein [Bacteroidia bacterium]
MKKLLPFIVVTMITTYTATAQDSLNKVKISEKNIAPENITITKTNAGDNIHGLVITDLNMQKNIMDPAITLYPNPSSELLNISFNSNSQSNISIEILDIMGKKVLDENFNAQIGNNVHTIFINRFKNGLYYVNVRNENGVTTQRFTKN